MSTVKKPVVIGGKLKLKSTSSSSAAQNKSNNSSNIGAGSLPNSSLIGKKRPAVVEITPEDVLQDKEVPIESHSSSAIHLTDAQRRAREKQRQMEEERLKKHAVKPYRERVEEYNEKLSKLTEHNDIPRVSAAGNG